MAQAEFFEQALRDYLLTDALISAEVDDRAYIGPQPQGDVSQANLMMHRITGSQISSHGGHSGQETCLMQIDIHTCCRLNTMRLAALVERALTPRRCVPAIGGPEWQSSLGYVERRGRTGVLFDSQTKMHRITMDFYFLIPVSLE